MDTASGNYQNAPADRSGNSVAANRAEDLTQDQVSEIMYRARTQEQIANAWQVRSAYLLAHPDDEAIMEEGESLWMREQALKYPDAPKVSTQ